MLIQDNIFWTQKCPHHDWVDFARNCREGRERREKEDLWYLMVKCESEHVNVKTIFSVLRTSNYLSVFSSYCWLKSLHVYFGSCTSFSAACNTAGDKITPVVASFQIFIATSLSVVCYCSKVCPHIHLKKLKNKIKTDVSWLLLLYLFYLQLHTKWSCLRNNLTDLI